MPHIDFTDDPLVARVLETHARQDLRGALDLDDLGGDDGVRLAEAPVFWVGPVRIIASTSTPSTRRLLDGVAVGVSTLDSTGRLSGSSQP